MFVHEGYLTTAIPITEDGTYMVRTPSGDRHIFAHAGETLYTYNFDNFMQERATDSLMQLIANILDSEPLGRPLI